MGSQARMGTEDGQSGQAKRRPAPSGPYRTQAAPAGLSEHRSGRSGLTGSRAGKHRVSSLLARHRGTSLRLLRLRVTHLTPGFGRRNRAQPSCGPWCLGSTSPRRPPTQVHVFPISFYWSSIARFHLPPSDSCAASRSVPNL